MIRVVWEMGRVISILMELDLCFLVYRCMVSVGISRR